MREQLFELENQFQPFLLGNDYTFIGPIDSIVLSKFYEIVNKFAPRKGILRSIHHALIDKNAVKKALLLLSKETELRIYVVISNGHRSKLFHTSIIEYCQKNNIIFNF